MPGFDVLLAGIAQPDDGEQGSGLLFDLDVTALTIGHSLFVRAIKPEKFTVLNDPDTPICTGVAPRAEEAPAAAPEEAAIAEPELIRKPKAEGEGEDEAEKKA